MSNSDIALFSFTSEEGDFIGQGRQIICARPQDSIVAEVVNMKGDRNGIRVVVHHMNDNWALEFAAPKGKALKPGKYENATRLAFHADHLPGLSVSGCGRGSNQSWGEFTIERISFSRNGEELRGLEMSFIHRDVGHRDEATYSSVPALRGEFRWRKSAPKRRRSAAGKA